MQNDAAALAGLRAEVRNARQVSHPNVCRVYDIGEVDGRHFLTMEYIDGDELLRPCCAASAACRETRLWRPRTKSALASPRLTIADCCIAI